MVDTYAVGGILVELFSGKPLYDNMDRTPLCFKLHLQKDMKKLEQDRVAKVDDRQIDTHEVPSLYLRMHAQG